MATKNERLVFLTTPDFKSYVSQAAAEEGISVAELVRRRVQGHTSEDEALLASLTKELRERVARTETLATEVFAEVDQLLDEIRARGSGDRPIKEAA